MTTKLTVNLQLKTKNSMEFFLTAENISKKFDKNFLFRNINISISQGTVLTLTGRNGAGKSTLLQILAGLISPTQGKITFQTDTGKEDIKKHSALVSPYINLYDELNLDEHIRFVSNLRNLSIQNDQLNEFKEVFQLSNNKKIIKYYSSGMKQKAKYILAMITNPKIYFFDEPFTNLDKNGIDYINSFIEKKQKKTAFVIASNYILEQSFSTQNVDLSYTTTD